MAPAPAYDVAIGVVRVGGTISRVGVPQYEEAPVGFASLFGKLMDDRESIKVLVTP